MKLPFERGLRRIVDSLQRGLFDEDECEPARPVAPAPSNVAGELLRHPRANRELVVDGRPVAFLFARSRRRSIGFLVGAEGLSVRAPKWVALRDVDAAVHEKGAWIVAKLDEQGKRAARTRATRTVWRDGVTVAYLGDAVTIVLDAQSGLA